MTSHDIIIIGAGLAGLSAAIHLHRAGHTPLILEASDGVGGRVRTDQEAGYLFDRGFQVLLTAYPEAQRLLNYDELDLRSFYPGALVRAADTFERFADPIRRPLDGLWHTALGARRSATLKDKLLVGKLRFSLGAQTHEQLCASIPDIAAIDWLKAQGLSDRIINTFFRAFFGGVTLDPDLLSSSLALALTYKYFAAGDIAIPAKGIGQLSSQLAAQLPANSIRLNSPVTAIKHGEITLADGEQLNAHDIIVATDNAWASEQLAHVAPLSWRHVTCYYFGADHPPIEAPILMLNGEPTGPINNLFIPTQLSAAYAPAGKTLISATTLRQPLDPAQPTELEGPMRDQLTRWFGAQVKDWTLLKSYHIAHAQPDQRPGRLTPTQRPVQLEDHLFICGDHREIASIDGALRSGTRAAQALLATR